MSKKLPAWIVLTVISLVAALALGATYNGTKDRIAAQEAEKAVAVRQELLPQAADFEQIAAEGETEVFKGVDADGSAVGYVSVGTVTGFGGPVEVTVGMDGEGTLSGVRVGGSNFSETAGLGAKSKEPAFYEQFAGKTYPVDLSKNGGEIDAITAATITSSAVIRGVNETAKYIADVAGIKLKEPVVAIEELGDNRYGTTAQGVSGPFPVVVTVDDGGAVVAVEVLDTESANDISYLSRVQGNADYLNQFVGQTAVEAGALDTVSGATVSSSSVNSAVSKVLLFVNDPAAYAAQAAAEADVPDVAIPEGADTFTAQGKGLTGTFDVTISVDENAAVTGIEVGDPSTADDAPFLGQVKDNARFLAQFIGTAGNVAEADIDLVTGATISSKGVISAVNAAWNESQGIVEEPAPTEAPAAPAEEAGNTVKASGLTGTFPVTVELNEDGTVKAVTLGDSDSDMDKDFLAKLDDAFLAQFAGKALPVSVDAVAGATISSKAVIDAVNSFAAETAAPAEEAGNTVKASGLTGTFPVTVELNEDGTVKAVTLGDSDSDMDKSFLALANTDAFLGQFIGKSLPVSGIDAASGATVSSSAIIEAVNSFASGTEENESKAAAEAQPAALDGVFELTAQGFTDPVRVTVTVENGAIAQVEVAESDSASDAMFVKLVGDNQAFLDQFIGKTAPIAEGEVDVVAGATFASKAVIDCVNQAFDKLGITAPAEEPAQEETKEETKPVADGVYSVSAQGFIDMVNVTVTVQGGAVESVAVQESSSDTDAPYVAKVKDNEGFLNQFIGAKAPLDQIDAVTGATFSSNAVLTAVNQALSGDAAAESAEEAPAQEAAPEEKAVSGGVAKASGLTGTFPVTVELNDDGTVKAVTLGDSDSDMDKEYLAKLDDAFLAQFAGKALPVSADTVAGATISSTAVIEAVNGFAAAPAEAEASEEAAQSEAGEYTVSARSFLDDLDVTVTMDENAVVTAVTVADAADAMNAPYVAKVQDEAFLSQYIGQDAPAEDVQVITGATFSSNAVTEAVNSVFAQLGVTVPEKTAAPEAPAPEAHSYRDGIYKTSVNGMNGAIELTVTIENGAVAAVTVGDTDAKEDALYVDMVRGEAFLNQFQGAAAPIESVDAITGATFSAQAVTRGVNLVLESAE
ncbi:MAG: RnfABCDGE type electron transport complex subunit G [Clostridia bacterium]|nr:RnfABCDGE type electron transport complex subunit G [Clostridia bacterium]